MANQWPRYDELDSSNLQDSFQLAREFELHCVKVFDHAARHPSDAASADYVMQFAAQAYQAVHSLYIQRLSSSYWDLKVATSELESRAIDYREGRESLIPNNTHPCKVPPPLDHQEKENLAIDVNETIPPSDIGKEECYEEQEEEESEDDDDWEESEEETDDEYYEYYEGSDADSELEELATVDTHNIATHSSAKDPVEDHKIPHIVSTSERALPKDPTPPSTTSILQDQAMHDRITAALQQIFIPLEDPNQTSLERTETQTTHTSHPPVYTITPPVTPPADDTQSEATAAQTQSNQESAQEASAINRKSFDAGPLHRKLTSGSPNGMPRRLKTVCYKYIRRAMVPIRGKTQ
ncbi:hypothetical protein N7478_007467 [Penicillium angulare]|uniref:uncharacterized protein n=1 Tax=Penicillium angulare TaxID=116970 RepID=UPI00253F8BF5|nr:uncharacterized protein N7478_007467 [Penicillium angulare]KAJ5272342.1 hypothetical protein N7478_007467 [Penicillium angulare]